MKIFTYICSILLLSFLSGCDKTVQDFPTEPETPSSSTEEIPEGYFVATFSALSPESRVPVTGTDTRVQYVRYLLYQSTGEFVKERLILQPGTTATWPLSAIRDTLPNGNYKVVFLANVEKTLFPYQNSGSPITYSDVLKNYTINYDSARIYLPNTEFKANTEYYWAKADFSNLNPTPAILLQRIISLLNVHRNFVDAQTALNQLVNNIVTQVGYKNILQNTIRGILHTSISPLLLGLGDIVLNSVIDALVQPVLDALYTLLVQQLINELGTTLKADENQNGLLGVLGLLLNPWEGNEAHTAIVTINNFPKSINYNLTVKEVYTGPHTFRFDFVNNVGNTRKSLDIKGFSGVFDIREINVIKQGLVSGLVVDRLVDGPLLLDGTFIDIKDPLTYTPGTNKRYKSDYSFIDLGLQDYTQQTDGEHNMSLTLQLGSVGNLDQLLGKIPLLGTVLINAIKQITITVPLNLPLLGVENLKLSGGWSTPAQY